MDRGPPRGQDLTTYGLATANLDGDGRPEVVTANSDGPNVVSASLPVPGAEAQSRAATKIRSTYQKSSATDAKSSSAAPT